MKLEYLRILHIFSVLNLVTGIIFAYRYIWFSIETVPEGRLAAFALTVILFGMVSAGIEAWINDENNKKNGV